MSELGPKKMPTRKAKAFKGARERIVRTDKRLSVEEIAHAHQKRRADAFESVLTDPTHSAFIESLYRQTGVMMADILLEKLREENGEALERIADHALRAVLDEAGSLAAEQLARAIDHKAAVRMNPYEAFEERAVDMVASVETIQPIQIRHVHRFGY